MKLIMLITADYASIDPGTGKLDILGAFTEIKPKKFPTVHARMALVVKLVPAFQDHADERKLAIELRDEDGTRYMRIEGPFNFPHGAEGRRPEFTAVLELNSLPFPHPGGYEFEVYVDDELQGQAPIVLVQPPQQPE